LGLTTGGLSSVKVQVNAADRHRAAAILASTEGAMAMNILVWIVATLVWRQFFWNF